MRAELALPTIGGRLGTSPVLAFWLAYILTRPLANLGDWLATSTADHGAAWAAFDPATVITRHGPYHGVAGWFAVAPFTTATPMPAAKNAAAKSLCGLGAKQGIDCAVVIRPGRHDGGFAAAASPWLSGKLGI